MNLTNTQRREKGISMRKILAWLIALAVGLPMSAEAVDFSDWMFKNLGDGKGIQTKFTSCDGQKSIPAIFSPNNGSWTFYVKNIQPQELEGIKTIYLSANIMSNNPKAIQLVIGENDEWGNAMRRMTAVRPDDIPYTWQHISVKLDRIMDGSFFSLGIGVDYKAAGTWLAIDDVIISDQPIPTPEVMPQYDITIPMAFGNLAQFTDLATTILKMAELDPEMKNIPGFEQNITWLNSQHPIDSTETMRVFNNMEKQYSIYDFAIMPVNSTFDFDFSTVFPNRSSQYTHVMPNNAREGFIVLVRNNFDKPHNFTITLSGKAAEFTNVYKLLEVDGVPDMPIKLKHNDIIHIGAKETMGIMLRFESTQSGIFDGEIDFTPFDPQLKSKKLPFTLEVTKTELPDTMPIKIFHWDYSGALEPQKLDLLLDGRVNVFHIRDLATLYSAEMPTDFSYYAKVIQAVKKAAPDLDANFVIEEGFIRKNGGWKKEYEPWLDKLIETLEAEGIGYDKWYLHIYDEDLSDEFLESAKAIKAYNPNVRIMSDCLNQDDDIIERFDPYVDIWCPVAWFFPPYMQEYKEKLDQLRSVPTEYWIYACGPVPANPSRRFRELPIYSSIYDMDGCCYWTTYYLYPRGAEDNTGHYGFFYKMPDGSVEKSRRWLEWQAGLNDYVILELGKNGDTKEQVKAIHDYALKHLTAPDFWANYTKMRADLLRALNK